MMRVIYVAVAVLSLLSVGDSAPETDCDSLIQPVPIQGTAELLGKWIYIAQTSDESEFASQKDSLETVWANFTAANGSDVVHELHMQKMSGRCIPFRMKTTLTNGTLNMLERAELHTSRLPTNCPDCLVLLLRINARGFPYSVLLQMSKREKVSDAELQEFLKQAECLKLPSPHVMDPEKGFCPAPPSE